MFLGGGINSLDLSAVKIICYSSTKFRHLLFYRIDKQTEIFVCGGEISCKSGFFCSKNCMLQFFEVSTSVDLSDRFPLCLVGVWT